MDNGVRVKMFNIFKKSINNKDRKIAEEIFTELDKYLYRDSQKKLYWRIAENQYGKIRKRFLK